MFNHNVKIYGKEPYLNWEKCRLFLSMVSPFGTHNILVGEECKIPILKKGDTINISFKPKRWKRNLIDKLDLDFRNFKRQYEFNKRNT
jgi:hypothetical protein